MFVRGLSPADRATMQHLEAIREARGWNAAQVRDFINAPSLELLETDRSHISSVILGKPPPMTPEASINGIPPITPEASINAGPTTEAATPALATEDRLYHTPSLSQHGSNMVADVSNVSQRG